MNTYRLTIVAFAGLAFAAPWAVHADVLTYTNGRQMKGIVEESSPDSTKVKFIGSSGSFMVPRTRIKSIQKEPLAEGYIHIGDDFRSKGNYGEAIEQYQRALSEDSSHTGAQERIEQTRDALEEVGRLRRGDDIAEIDDIGAKVRGLIRIEDYEEAERYLQRASALVPNDEQVEQLQKLVGDLYLAWARYHLDRFDKVAAEEKLDLALVAQPRNDEVIALLLTLWEGQADKQDQVLRIFETALENRPDDVVLRRKVADLTYADGDLEGSLYHYLILYERTERKSKTSLERKVIDNLKALHQKKAAARDFEKAIDYYNLLAEIVPNSDPSVILYYRFRQRAAVLEPEDIAGRVELAQFAEQAGLASLALQTYRKILESDEDSAEAQQGVARFALAAVQRAEKAYERGDYIEAKLAASRVVYEYKDAQESVGRALQIKARAETQIERDRRDQREQAMDYVARGDQYFERASRYYAAYYNREVASNTYRTNPKADAVSNYRSAIDAYEDALRRDPSLDSDTSSFVGPNMREAKRKLKELTSAARRPGTTQSRRNQVY